MNPDEWEVYAETFGAMKRFLRYPDLVIYLRGKPETCAERIAQRDRTEESGIPIDYLRGLHQKHEEFATAMAHYTRLLVQDWSDYDQDMGMVNTQVDELLAQPVGFMRDWNKL